MKAPWYMRISKPYATDNGEIRVNIRITRLGALWLFIRYLPQVIMRKIKGKQCIERKLQ